MAKKKATTAEEAPPEIDAQGDVHPAATATESVNKAEMARSIFKSGTTEVSGIIEEMKSRGVESSYQNVYQATKKLREPASTPLFEDTPQTKRTPSKNETTTTTDPLNTLRSLATTLGGWAKLQQLVEMLAKLEEQK